MKSNARFSFEKLEFSQDKDLHLVVSLTAPKIDWQNQRPAICIVPVIDVSGSMSGEKLAYAKQSVLKLIDHLQPGDYCGLVIFESRAHTISKPVEMTQAKKDELKTLVGQLAIMGGTNFSGGMLEGLAHANKMDLPHKVLTRVIMFTDGQPTEGVAINRDSLLPLLEANLGRATLSAFGYGASADHDLLSELAKKGNGNYAFVKNPDDALSAFARELGGLLSSYAQNIKVTLKPHGEHKIHDILSDVDSEEKGDHVVVTLPDILSEEIRHLVFAVKVAKQPNAFPRATSVVDVTIDYECLDSKGKKNVHREELKGKLKFVKAGDEDKAPIKDVMDLVGTAILVQKQVEAEVFAKQGNYLGAQGVMASAFTLFDSYNMHSHAIGAANIGGKMASAAVYNVSSGYLNSTKTGGTRGTAVSSYDPEAEVMLKSLNVATSTAAQDSVASSFSAPNGDALRQAGMDAAAEAAAALPPVPWTNSGVVGHAVSNPAITFSTGTGFGIQAVGGTGLGGIVGLGGGDPGLSFLRAPVAPVTPRAPDPIPPPPPSPKKLTKTKSKRW